MAFEKEQKWKFLEACVVSRIQLFIRLRSLNPTAFLLPSKEVTVHVSIEHHVSRLVSSCDSEVHIVPTIDKAGCVAIRSWHLPPLNVKRYMEGIHLAR